MFLIYHMSKHMKSKLPKQHSMHPGWVQLADTIFRHTHTGPGYNRGCAWIQNILRTCMRVCEDRNVSRKHVWDTTNIQMHPHNWITKNTESLLGLALGQLCNLQAELVMYEYATTRPLDRRVSSVVLNCLGDRFCDSTNAEEQAVCMHYLDPPGPERWSSRRVRRASWRSKASFLVRLC